LLADVVAVAILAIRSRRTLEAENLVLRRQLALLKERGVKPRRIDAATRMSGVVVAVVRLALLPDHRSPGKGGPLAPRRMATSLALQTEAR
jgi:hypothetical protein